MPLLTVSEADIPPQKTTGTKTKPASSNPPLTFLTTPPSGLVAVSAKQSRSPRMSRKVSIASVMASRGGMTTILTMFRTRRRMLLAGLASRLVVCRDLVTTWESLAMGWGVRMIRGGTRGGMTMIEREGLSLRGIGR